MRYLTKIDIAVKNDKGDFTFKPEEEYDATAALNYLIYWASNYHLYEWDEKQSAFVRDQVKLETVSAEEQLFMLLNDDSASLAIAAYRKLSEGNVAEVQRLTAEYGKYNVDHNWVIGVFPYKFLKQLVLFTAYCRNEGFAYQPTPKLEVKLQRLTERIPFDERREIEDELSKTLSFEEITMLE